MFTLTTGNGIIPVWTMPITALAYALPIVYGVTLIIGDGRTLYDRIAGTVVALSD